MASPVWLKQLESIPAIASVTDAATLDAHAAQGVRPACLCAPESAAHAAAIVKFAAANKIPVLPRGSGTAQGIGSAPPPDALVLSTRRMSALIQHEPADMVATVQAGMELGALQRELAKNGQWLPLDGDPRATIGGLIATDRSGPRALGYGTLRDMVLGMSIVNGDGVLRKCGGKVVKNVTGYDLAKLYIGSLGTLGLVTEATFKLRPLPVGRRAWTAQFDLIKGMEFRQKLAALNLPLESLEVFIEPAAATCEIAAYATGTADELDRISKEIAAIAAKHSATPVESLASNAWDDSRRRPHAPDSAQNGFEIRVWFVPSKASDALKALGDKAAAICLSADSAVALFPKSTEIAAELQKSLARSGLNYRFENAHGLKIDQPFGPPRPEWALMKQIRAALDPQGIMNPGRFVV